MSKKIRAKDEFRYNYAKGHKNYVFAETDDGIYICVGITHESSTFSKPNMPLEKNPQRGKTEKAYIRNGIISDKKKYYGKKLKNYSFSSNDRKNVKSKIRNYKKKRKKTHKKSK